MSDTNVKIKLTADSKQVRNEIKLIDQELAKLGGSSRKSGGSKTSTEDNKKSSIDKPTATTNAKEEARDKVQDNLYRELTLIRKELKKINGGGVKLSNSTVPKSNPTPSHKEDFQNKKQDDKINPFLKQITSAAFAMKAISSAWNYFSSGARDSASGESLAYNTYGSTLAYKDYYTAKKDATNLGADYGYNYDTVMSASSTNMSKAGFTNIEDHKADMNGILMTSKAWGLDPSSLAGTSGYMTSIGVTNNGEQTKFANLLAESIIDAQMTGREDEQLQVLEDISQNLAKINTTVSENSLKGSLEMYNALVAQDEHLKGTRGSNLVTTMQDIAAGGNQSLDILAGFGTKYTGLNGQLELRKLAEENPNQYWAQVYEGVKNYHLGDDYFKKLLYDNVGSISEAEAIMKSLPGLSTGEFNMDDTTNGESATKHRIDNYHNSDVYTQEKYAIEKQDTKESAGEFLNNILSGPRKFYNSLPSWAQFGVDGAIGIGKLGLGYAGVKAGGKWITGLLGKGGTAAGVTLSGEVASTASKAGKLGKWMGKYAPALGLGLEFASGVGDILSADTDYEKSSAWGGLFGRLGGYAAGLAAGGGPLGVLAIGGAWAGKELAKSIFESAHNGKENYGTVLAGDWNPFGGAHRRNGTLTQQQHRDWNKSEAKRVYGGLPSDFGMPEAFDEALTSGGDINWGGIENDLNPDSMNHYRMESKYGMNLEEVQKWKNSDEYNSYIASKQEKQDRYNNLDAQSIWLKEGDKGYDKSLDKSGYGYSVWTGSQDELNEWLKEQEFISDGSPSKKGDIDLPYFMNELSSDSQDAIIDSLGVEDVVSSNTDLSDSVDELTDEISEMRQWLLSNGYNGVYAWSDSTVKDTYHKARGIGTDVKSPIFPFLHATGNDYIPYDNYLASLHKGEMVLTAYEADQYRQGKVGNNGTSSGSLDLNINLTGSIQGMTTENQNKIVQAVIAQLSVGNLQNMISTGFQRVQNA